MIKAFHIKNLRRHLDVSQSEFSAYLGVTQTHLSRIESHRRSVPQTVADRIEWTLDQVEKNGQAFDKSASRQVLSNKLSVAYAWKALKEKKFELETNEMELKILLRENIRFARTAYLLQELRPSPGLKLVALNVFKAWKKLQCRLAEQKIEKSGPSIILKQEMKIAALRSEISCLEDHLGLSAETANTSKVKAT